MFTTSELVAYSLGLTNGTELARRHGVGRRRVDAELKKAGLETVGKHPSIRTGPLVEAALAMRRCGYTNSYIANRLGVTAASVAWLLRPRETS